MSRSIAKAGQYKFGECGFIVDGVLLQNGTKLKNMRIFRQRSHRLYDILDPQSEVIYRKVSITTTNKDGYLLDYRKTNDQLLNEINLNSFFVRGHTDKNQSTDPTGFVYKFLYRKVFLGDSTPLFNMYTPECGIVDHDIDNILVFPCFVGDDMVGGRLFNAWEQIDTTGMVITVVFEDGTYYSTTEIIDDVFSIDVPEIENPGTAKIWLTSPIYNTKEQDFQILPQGQDVGFVTSVLISTFEFDPSTDMYSSNVPSDVHERGNDLVLQAYDENGNMIIVDSIVDETGNITIEQSDNEITTLNIVGKTIDTTPFTKQVTINDWNMMMDLMYEIIINQSDHGKIDPQIQIYDSDNHIVLCEIQLDENDNITIKSVIEFDCKIVIVGYDK